MARSRYQKYVGTHIGQYLILEELGTVGNTPQARYSNRKFRVRDTISGFEMVLRMSSIRNKGGHRNRSAYPRFRDYTGQTIGDWEVLDLANDGPIQKGDKDGSLWNCCHVLTGEKAVKSYSQMKPRRRESTGRHGCRTASFTHPLYNIWTSLRSSTGNQTDTRWHNWGALGYTIDRKRWNNFENFKNDILNTIGARPGSRACLFPIEGTHFCHENVEWRIRYHRNVAATVPGNLLPKNPDK